MNPNLVLFAGVLFLAAAISTVQSTLLPSSNCQTYCSCDFDGQSLSILCSSAQASTGYFNLPSVTISTQLQTTSIISIRNSYLTTFPSNICQYASSLQQLDLSMNAISTTLSSANFNCLTQLTRLNLSRNSLKTLDETTFGSLNSLLVLDLSYNQISSLPTNLFTYKLPYLNYISLRNNLLTSIDPWFFYLQRINYIDLSYNQISTFTNNIGFSVYGQNYYAQNTINVLDLRNNQFAAFDDNSLRTLGLCDYESLNIFLHLVYNMRIDQNPFYCDCTASYNLLSFFQTLVTNNAIRLSNNVFLAQCISPSIYFSDSIFAFTTNTNCASPSVSFSQSCKQASTTTSTTTQNSQIILVGQLIVNTDDTVNNIPSELTGAQIAGIVIGVIAFCLLILTLMYCLFRIETNALCFACMPCFYWICPCKKNDQSSKYYDLFVAYNLASDQWIRNKLIPFLKIERPLNKFFLQYSERNPNQDVFSPYMKKVMENSACILLILSEPFIMKEWQNEEFRKVIRHLVANNETRLVCVQMHDISDEEADDYVRDCLQVAHYPSIESDELLFWRKLMYYLYTNRKGVDVVAPRNYEGNSRDRPARKPDGSKPADYVSLNIQTKPNDGIEFQDHRVSRPLIHLPGIGSQSRSSSKKALTGDPEKPYSNLSLDANEYDEYSNTRVASKKKRSKQIATEAQLGLGEDSDPLSARPKSARKAKRDGTNNSTTAINTSINHYYKIDSNDEDQNEYLTRQSSTPKRSSMRSKSDTQIRAKKRVELDVEAQEEIYRHKDRLPSIYQNVKRPSTNIIDQ